MKLNAIADPEVKQKMQTDVLNDRNKDKFNALEESMRDRTDKEER